MNPSLYRKIIYGSVLAGLVLLILFPGEIFGFLFDVLHHFFEISLESGHLLFEVAEMALDHLIEHLFHTSLHITQTIVFYILLIPVLYIGYRLLRWLIAFSRRCAARLTHAYTDYKNYTVSFWHSMDALDKIKWIAILGVGLYLISLISF